MKTKIIISLLLALMVPLACSAKTMHKQKKSSLVVKTERFEVADSIRMFEKSDPNGVGYKYVSSVKAEWPVSINGKYSEALTKFLLDSLFYAKDNRNAFPYYPDDVNVIKDFVGDYIYHSLNNTPMLEDYIKKSPLVVPDIDAEKNPMSCWYDYSDFKPSHSVKDLMFFVTLYQCYYGGAHDDFMARYLAFDAKLNKPIGITDIVRSQSKVLQMLPSYDHRDPDVKWWDNVTDISNFYIKNGKLVFVFDPYVIGPFCDGIIEIAVPFSTLKKRGLLTPYGMNYLK